MKVIWNDEKHGQNIPLIDNQHKELFVLTNRLYTLVNSHSEEKLNEKRELISIFKNLYNYSNYHFLTEEELFFEYNYPEADQHIAEHAKFKKTIKSYLEDLKTDKHMSLEYLQDFLVEWILKHIQGEDRRYIDYFKANGFTSETKFMHKELSRGDTLALWEQKKLQMDIATIDTQHRQLIGILQQTNDLQHTSAERKKIFIPIIIGKLLHYAQYHFTFEEELMAKYNCPELIKQKEQHSFFVKDIIRIEKDYIQGNEELTDVIIYYLRDWILGHITNEDRKYIRNIPKSGL